MRTMKTENIPFVVTALLGQTTLPMSAYLDLQIGDILVLDQPIDKEIVIRFGQQKCYLGTTGLCETHKAVIFDERIHSR